MRRWKKPAEQRFLSPKLAEKFREIPTTSANKHNLRHKKQYTEILEGKSKKKKTL